MNTTALNSNKKVVSKFQHLVIYVDDLAKSKKFYMDVFDLQFSALNHPDGSAAMKMSKQEMHFFSFGFYHHDICLVKHHKFKMDNDSMLHYSLIVRDIDGFDKIEEKVKALQIPFKQGRLIASAKMESNAKAICFEDPNKHWIELIYRP